MKKAEGSLGKEASESYLKNRRAHLRLVVNTDDYQEGTGIPYYEEGRCIGYAHLEAWTIMGWIIVPVESTNGVPS